MRVVLLKMQSKQRGGLEKYTGRIAAAFTKIGADVTLLTTDQPKTPLPGVEYCAFPICRWPRFLALEHFDYQVCRWQKKHPADIVFGMERHRMQTHIRAGNGVHAAFLKSRIASEGRLKYGLCRMNPLHRKILDLEKSAFENPALRKIFVNSRMVRNDLLTYYQVDPIKIEVVYNGVEWKEHEVSFGATEQGKQSAFKNFGIDPNAFQLLFVGNGYLRKGLKPLLNALSLWKFKNFHLSIVGKEKNISRYRTFAERFGLRGRVRFFGAQNEMTPFYQMADVLAIPSTYDPFANVTLEALSFGVFVISSKSNGGHEILTEENGAVIEDLSSPDSILTALDISLHYRKTPQRAEQIRSSISHLDFSNQLSKLIDACNE